MYISKQNYLRTANLLYWNKHYAPISSVSRLFYDITNHRETKHLCLRCLQHFTFEDVLKRHQKQCSREDFMSVLHVLPTTDLQECVLRFSAFRQSTCAPFVIYANFESILKPIDKVTKATTYFQQHDLCSAAALLVSTIPKIYNTFAIFTGRNALSKFLNQLINWETKCIKHLKQNAPINKLNEHSRMTMTMRSNVISVDKIFMGRRILKRAKSAITTISLGSFWCSAQRLQFESAC